MQRNISGMAKGTLAALTLTAAASNAFAQSRYTDMFNGNTINCAKLQGQNNPTPGGFTCGFAQEIDQYMQGAKLSCSGGEGDSFAAMGPAASHMANFHGQPGLFMHLQTQIALYNASKNAQEAVKLLERDHPGQGLEFFYTHYAIEAMATLLRQGHSFDASVNHVVSKFNEWGRSLPGGGTSAESFKKFLLENPIVDARLVCLQQYKSIPWSNYER